MLQTDLSERLLNFILSNRSITTTIGFIEHKKLFCAQF